MMHELADIFPVLLAGMAIGCMLMAVLQRHVPRIRRSVEDGNASSAKFPPVKVVPIDKREVRR
jgi:hypothetical protein